MQVSDDRKLAEQAQEVLEKHFGFNAFDETWVENSQEDGGICWTNTEEGFTKISRIKPRIRRIDAASSPAASQATAHRNDGCETVPQCDDASSHDLPPYATGGGGTAGNSGNF